MWQQKASLLPVYSVCSWVMDSKWLRSLYRQVLTSLDQFVYVCEFNSCQMCIPVIMWWYWSTVNQLKSSQPYNDFLDKWRGSRSGVDPVFLLFFFLFCFLCFVLFFIPHNKFVITVLLGISPLIQKCVCVIFLVANFPMFIHKFKHEFISSDIIIFHLADKRPKQPT